jgi:hypothetical protein
MNKLFIKNGVILSLIYILLTLILFIVNLDMEQWAKWIVLGITFIFIILFVKFQADELPEQEATFSTLFKNGFLTSLVFTSIICVFMVLYVSVIDVHFYQKIENLARTKMMEENISEEKIEDMLKLSKTYMTIPFLLFSTFLSNIITCNLGNLIGALIFRKDKN